MYDDEVAVPSGLTLSGAQSIVFDGQKVTPTIAGQYAFNAEISTTAAPNAKLNVYAVANGETSLVKSTAFTANTEGNFQNGQVVFNVYDSMVGKEFAFGYEQADGSVVTLKDVTLVRLGDAVDPDPVVIKEWTPKEMADNAEAKTRFTYPTKTATVGYRMFGNVEPQPGNADLEPYIVQWSRADVMTGGFNEEDVLPDDVIRMGVYFDYDQGLADDANCGFTAMYKDFATEIPCGGQNISGVMYNQLEEQFHEVYQYPYREVSAEFTVTDADAPEIVKNGFKILIGCWDGPNYEENPQTVYGFYVYNATQDIYLFQKNGAELTSMGWTKNTDYLELVEAEYEDRDVISGINFLAADSAVNFFKAPMTSDVTEAGEYTVTLKDLAIEGDGAVNVTAGVMVDGALVPLTTQAVTADSPVVKFNVTNEMAAYPVAFNVQQDAGVSTTISSAVLTWTRYLDADEDTADISAAFGVKTLIAKLPVPVSLSDKAAIEAARAAYNGLTETQQALVDNLNALTKAEADLEILEEGKEAADAVIAKIAALPEATALTLDNETAVNEAKAAYDALDDLVKATLVDDASKQKLNACVAKIAALKADKAAADAVIALIDALPENATPADAEQVNAAKAAYEALTEDQKKLVGADKVEKLEKALEAIQEPDVIYGDVNNDKKVDATDALWVLQHSVELRTLTETELKAADVTDLGKVDTRDALQILQKTVELIDKFDVEK